MRLVHLYVELLDKKKGAWFVILAWIGVTAIGGWQTPAFVDACTTNSHSPWVSPAVVALEYLNALFGDRGVTEQQTIMLVENRAGVIAGPENTTSGFLRTVQEALWDEAAHRYPQGSAPLMRVDTPFLVSMRNLSSDSATHFRPADVLWFRTPCPAAYWSADNRTAMLKIYHRDYAAKWIYALLRRLEQSSPPTLAVSVTSGEVVTAFGATGPAPRCTVLQHVATSLRRADHGKRHRRGRRERYDARGCNQVLRFRVLPGY
jgi:hypothetical protein